MSEQDLAQPFACASLSDVNRSLLCSPLDHWASRRATDSIVFQPAARFIYFEDRELFALPQRYRDGVIGGMGGHTRRLRGDQQGFSRP